MADNFDLKKFLKESKALENLNPSVKSINEGEAAYEYEKGKEAGEHEKTKAKIREYILAELGGEIAEDAPEKDKYDFLLEDGDEDYELEDRKTKYGINPEMGEEDLEEAKKKKDEEVEDTETIDATIEDIPVEDEIPAEDTSTDGGGLEDIAADMKGTEGDLMDSLMKALKIAKGMNNEKLETQIGNTLKFFVSEYIGGGQE
jgi:hypothetical protein